MTKRSIAVAKLTVGLDLGDRFSVAAVLDTRIGELLHEWRIRTTAAALARRFEGQPRMRIALEVGTHSPWVSRLLASWGHEVLVANPRKVRLISHSRRKSDRFDGRTLARLARLDPELLAPVRHRSATCQRDLGLLRSRAALVRARTLLANHLRGALKAVGVRLPKCSAESLAARATGSLAEPLRAGVAPVLAALGELSAQIRAYDRQIETLAKSHPEVEPLRQIAGVGPLTSLAFVLTLEQPS